jgi:hypothetical protein
MPKIYTELVSFEKRYDAFRYLKKIKKPSVLPASEDGSFVKAKALIKPNGKNIYYPSWVIIDIQSGGEHWATHFYNKKNELVSDEDKKINLREIRPYDYDTLIIIEGDFHQLNPIKSNHYQTIGNAVVNENIETPSLRKTKIRSYFSLQHLMSSIIFYKKIIEIEKKFQKDYKTKSIDTHEIIEHRSFCVSIVFSIVSFLEANINEFYMDSSDNRDGIVVDLKNEEVELLKNLWQLEIPKTASYTIIEKYQIALTLLRKKQIPGDRNPLQSVDVLIKLRNSLIHYEPEWEILDEKRAQINLSKKLDSKFKLNKYAGEYASSFPDKYLSADMCKWSIKSAIMFADLFYEKLEIIPLYEKIRNMIDDIG